MNDSKTTFAGVPSCATGAVGSGAVAVIGASEASPYDSARPSHSAEAPGAIRRASAQFAQQFGQFDFDTESAFMGVADDKSVVVDCGDIATDRADAPGNRTRITQAIRTLLDRGAIPVLLGGDDSVPIPAFAAYEGRGSLSIVQVDAHVDWGDEIKGNALGYGSTMRRAAGLPFVADMLQVGIRGLGSGTPDQMDDARAWGSRIVTMRDLRQTTIAALAEAIPNGQPAIVAIDLDGIDPTHCPGVGMPTPGGLTYEDVLDLLRAVAKRAPLVGCFVVELAPARDPHGASALLAARIACSAAGLIRSQAKWSGNRGTGQAG